MMKLHSRVIGTSAAVSTFTAVILIGEPAMAQVYWRNDTNFRFTRNGSRLSQCFYQWVSQEIECPKNTWLTPEPKCGNMVWLHNARINNKEKLLFTANFGAAEPSTSCKQLLKTLGPRKQSESEGEDSTLTKHNQPRVAGASEEGLREDGEGFYDLGSGLDASGHIATPGCTISLKPLGK
jgi:hypothetical protein